MRFILISTLYPNSKQPTRALYNQRHFEALHEEGHKVEVIAPIPWFPGKRNLPPTKELIGKILVHHPRFFYSPRILIEHHWRSYRFSVSKYLSKLLKNKNAEEVTHSNSEPEDSNDIHIILGFVYPDAVAMSAVCKNSGLPYSVFVLGSDFRARTKQKKFVNKVMTCLQEAPTIFCPGKTLKDDMTLAGIAEEKIFPFNNGTNKKIFYYSEQTNANQSTSSKAILYVGNLVDVKAPERLIRAFSSLSHSLNSRYPLLTLNIIGDGSLKKQLRKLSEELDITQQVKFLGRQHPEEIASRMQNADALCLCSKSEGMPNVVIEALSCGCPVVATSIGEIPYLIKEGVNGYTVPVVGQTEEQIITCLSAKLNKCIENNWNRKLIAEAMNSYSWENAAKEVLRRLTRVQ